MMPPWHITTTQRDELAVAWPYARRTSSIQRPHVDGLGVPELLALVGIFEYSASPAADEDDVRLVVVLHQGSRVAVPRDRARRLARLQPVVQAATPFIGEPGPRRHV